LKIIYAFIFVIFFLHSSSYASSNNPNTCQSVSLKAEILCKSFINNSFLIFKKYSGLATNKKLNLELKKCERFKKTFPIFCEIVKDKYKNFILNFFVIFCLMYLSIFIKRKIDDKRK